MIRANRALAHYRAHAADSATESGIGIFRRRTATSGDPSLHSHDAILRLVAIAEDFSSGRFVEEIEALLPTDPIVSSLWEAELDRSGDTWPKRNALWKKYMKVNVKDFPRHKELDGFIQARNAIAHGLGDLTRRQRRKREATTAELRNADITVRGNTLVIDSTHVETCVAVVREFVSWLDASC